MRQQRKAAKKPVNYHCGRLELHPSGDLWSLMHKTFFRLNQGARKLGYLHINSCQSLLWAASWWHSFSGISDLSCTCNRDLLQASATRKSPQAKRTMLARARPGNIKMIQPQEIWAEHLQLLLQAPNRNLSSFVFHFQFSCLPLCDCFIDCFLPSCRRPSYFSCVLFSNFCVFGMYISKAIKIGYEIEVNSFLLQALTGYPQRNICRLKCKRCFKDILDTFSVLAFVTNKMRWLES